MDVLYHRMSCVKIRGGNWPGAAPQELAGHWSVDGEQLHCALIVLYILHILLVVSVLVFSLLFM